LQITNPPRYKRECNLHIERAGRPSNPQPDQHHKKYKRINPPMKTITQKNIQPKKVFLTPKQGFFTPTKETDRRFLTIGKKIGGLSPPGAAHQKKIFVKKGKPPPPPAKKKIKKKKKKKKQNTIEKKRMRG